MTNRYAAPARVSSREQEREGFSLEVQEEALYRYAEQNGGTIVRLVRIAETASKTDQRKAFKEMIAYAKAHAHELDALLFFKVDRAARNLFDYVELELLERDYGVPSIYISQPTENTPAGRMMRRTLANMAAFYTEQQSLDVKDGIARRVKSGLFPNRPPYGYRARRVDGRSIVEVDPVTSRKVQRVFELYAHGSHTLDSLIDQLAREGTSYTDATVRFPRSKLHAMLRDRSYRGEIMFRGTWYPGTQMALLDRHTFERVQTLLGEQIYRAHEMLFAGELIKCGHCGHPITGERKTKATRRGLATYVYYRCARYNCKNHPRIRLKENQINEQVLGLFDRLRLSKPTQDWFRKVLRAKRQDTQQQTQQHGDELSRQLAVLRQQQDKLLNLHLADRIPESTFSAKQVELQDRMRQLERLRSDAQAGAGAGQNAEDLFELSQRLRDKWLTADLPTSRALLQTVCLNLQLDDVNLVPTMRKPFDVLAEGLESAESRGDRRRSSSSPAAGRIQLPATFRVIPPLPPAATLAAEVARLLWAVRPAPPAPRRPA